MYVLSVMTTTVLYAGALWAFWWGEHPAALGLGALGTLFQVATAAGVSPGPAQSTGQMTSIAVVKPARMGTGIWPSASICQEKECSTQGPAGAVRLSM